MQAPIALLATLTAGAACAEPPRAPAAQPVPPLGSTHVAPPGTMLPDTRPPPLPPPPAIVGLGHAARELSRGEGTRSHAGVVEALRALADAGARLAPGQLEAIEAIRRAADELERSPPISLRHADYTRYGLDAAVDLLASASPLDPMNLEEYLALVRELRHEVEVIDPDVPLLAQHRAVARAFRTAARAMYVAHGATPPELSAARESPITPPRPK